MAKVKTSAAEIAEEIAQGYRKPFEAFGRQWEGKVFYSDLHRRTKGQSDRVFLDVCRFLKAKGFYLHG